MVGARSMVGTAVGSRPKLNTVRTSAVNTMAETRAVRVRNSSSRSLRATVHACASSSPIGPRAPNRPPVRLRDVGGPPPCARRKVDEAAAPLERDVGRELDPLVDVVRRQHEHAAPPRRPAPPRPPRPRPGPGRGGGAGGGGGGGGGGTRTEPRPPHATNGVLSFQDKEDNTKHA